MNTQCKYVILLLMRLLELKDDHNLYEMLMLCGIMICIPGILVVDEYFATGCVLLVGGIVLVVGGAIKAGNVEIKLDEIELKMKNILDEEA